MKQNLKKIGAGLLILLLCIAGGAALMIGAYAIPTDRLRANVKVSVSTFEKEGMYPKLFDTMDSRLDNFTDSFMVANVITVSGNGVVHDSMSNYRAVYEDADNIEKLRLYADGAEPSGLWAYGRYWHGYLVFLKPLFLAFNYSQIRMLNMCAQLLLLAGLLWLLFKRNLARYAIAFFGAYVVLCPPALMMSLQFSPVFYISFGACLIMLLANDWLVKKGYGFFFLLIGIAGSFFDLLTYPMLTIIMPLALYYVLNPRQARGIRMLKSMVQMGAVWGLGYLGMWAGKWCAAYLLADVNFIGSSIEQIALRTSTESSSGESISIFYGLSRCLEVLGDNPVSLLSMAGCAAGALAVTTVRRKKEELQIVSFVPYALLAAVPFVWLIVTCNHSSIHFWFTYRNMAAVVFAVLCGLLAVAKARKQQHHPA